MWTIDATVHSVDVNMFTGLLQHILLAGKRVVLEVLRATPAAAVDYMNLQAADRAAEALFP